VYPFTVEVVVLQASRFHVAVSVTFPETVPEDGYVAPAAKMLVPSDQPANE
jgi:hypothetical protein